MREFLLVLVCISILIACGDSTEPSKKANNVLYVVDSATNQPLVNSYVVFDYLLDVEDYQTKEFSIAPNPTYDHISFYFEVKEIGDYSIEIVSQTDSAAYILMNYNFNDLGYHSYIYNLNDSVNIGNGFYTAYLKRSGELIDSITVVYFSRSQTLHYSNFLKKYFLNVYKQRTDNQGKISIEPDKFNLFDKSFVHIKEDGSIFGKLTVNRDILVSIYDSTLSNMKTQKVVPYQTLKDGYTIYIP